MFVEDLSVMPNPRPECKAKMLAIGWLDRLHQFPKGTTLESFRNKLREFCLNPIRLTRGFHRCPFCDKDDVRGNGEIDISSADGTVYTAPSLIWHYVVKHDYQPPYQFMDAIMATTNNAFDLGELSLCVLRLADEPTPESQRAFYETFVKSRVGIRIPAEFGSAPSGDYIINNESKISIPQGRLPDGTQVLIVLADVDKLAKVETNSTFMEFDAKDVIKMAAQNKTGIIVQAWLHSRKAWAGIAANELANLPNF